MQTEKYFDLLGKKATDRVTGFSGVIESVCFDLYGCVQAILRAKADKDGKLENAHWFDVSRLKVEKTARVMPVPDFGENKVMKTATPKGPAQKPLRNV